MSVDGILVSVYVIPVPKIKECSTRCNYRSNDEKDEGKILRKSNNPNRPITLRPQSVHTGSLINFHPL